MCDFCLRYGHQERKEGGSVVRQRLICRLFMVGMSPTHGWVCVSVPSERDCAAVGAAVAC